MFSSLACLAIQFVKYITMTENVVAFQLIFLASVKRRGPFKDKQVIPNV